MTIKTQYIAPVSLWLVVRKRFTGTGLFIEPAWVGDGTQNGPVIFTSHILAAVYAHMRNKYHSNDDSDNWRVMSLQAFDLLEHVRDCGGKLWCMMAFAAVLEDASSLIVKTGAPRIRYVPLGFESPKDTEIVTFSFDQWVFDYMRDEFRSIGLPDYEMQLEVVDEMDDATLALTLKYATERINVCREPSERKASLWGVYDPDAGVWVSAEETDRKPAKHTAHQLH
ncbi:hypothetical protein [Paraburkholderia dioscoreae]|uniref:Uncharacterized protein n=1 Tax=Paraburkholderia dioscoreae TaxID=2604047 RepID=A0A5Q4ZFT6_9BURK|nr:hypothetical protein [Paraburkholderia dioscoreae]VVD31773.1 conserved protein of unknown function [Paraburkholderia dioscoreae]